MVHGDLVDGVGETALNPVRWVQSTNRSEVSLTHQANGGQDPVWPSAESDLGQNPLTGEHFGGESDHEAKHG